MFGVSTAANVAAFMFIGALIAVWVFVGLYRSDPDWTEDDEF